MMMKAMLDFCTTLFDNLCNVHTFMTIFTKILSNNNVVHMLYFFILIAFSIGSLMVDIQTCHYYVLDKPHNTKDQENYVEDEIST